MKSFRIIDVKKFMNSLLIEELFDSFLCIQASITTYNTFSIDGRIHPDYYPLNEFEAMNMPEYATWKMNRPICFQMIKGKKTPVRFSVSLALSATSIEKYMSSNDTSIPVKDVASIGLNIKYEKNMLSVISAVSLNTFTMDKSLEHQWDDSVKKFLEKHFEVEEE